MVERTIEQRVQVYLRNLAPHVVKRQGAQLLSQLLVEHKRLQQMLELAEMSPTYSVSKVELKGEGTVEEMARDLLLQDAKESLRAELSGFEISEDLMADIRRRLGDEREDE